MPQKHPKIFVVQKVKVQLITKPDGSKDFAQASQNLSDQARSVRPKSMNSEAMI